jgi:oligosaccharyltransferase complex subunit delta (ribophorin II)
VLASFGASTPYNSPAFDLTISVDPNTPIAKAEPQLRYGKQPEIHHIFRSDPKSPPRIITLVFGAAVLAALPVLFGVWGTLGGNLNHLPKALGAAPLSHSLYFGSIIAMEGVFFLYYTSWNLFEILPVAAGVSLVIFLSGTRALSEVQQRRLDGQR